MHLTWWYKHGAALLGPQVQLPWGLAIIGDAVASLNPVYVVHPPPPPPSPLQGVLVQLLSFICKQCRWY